MMFIFCNVFWAYTIIIISGLIRVAVALCRIHDSSYIMGFGRGIAHNRVKLGKIGKIPLAKGVKIRKLTTCGLCVRTTAVFLTPK